MCVVFDVKENKGDIVYRKIMLCYENWIVLLNCLYEIVMLLMLYILFVKEILRKVFC